MDHLMPQMHMLSTNMMLSLKTGNILVDTCIGFLLASLVMYAMQCKQIVKQRGIKFFRGWFADKYSIRYQARVYHHRCTENLSESFVALKDWVVAGIKNDDFTNACTLSEIQVPRNISRLLDSVHPEENTSDISSNGEVCAKFNRSIMILSQADAIKHRTYDIQVKHETYSVGGGGNGKDEDEGLFSSSSRSNEYTEHTIILSSNTMTTNKLAAFVDEQIVKPFQERRRQREKGKLFYYLFDRQDEDTALCYEKYKWTSTKMYKHVVSEHTATVEQRINHFIHNRDWYINHGKPYSLTFLLHGPPGCGKTSLIKAVANATKRHIKEIPLPRVKDRQTLTEIFHGTHVGFQQVKPNECIYVFEEFDKMGSIVQENSEDQNKVAVDRAQKALSETDLTRSLLAVQQAVSHGNSLKNTPFHSKAPEKSGSTTPLSLGDILNVMDGLLEQDGIITFITANRIDHLHKAITRPGRIDLKLKFDKASTAALKHIVRMAYDIADADPCPAVDCVEDQDPRYHLKWSPAEIEEVCFQELSADRAMAMLENEVCA